MPTPTGCWSGPWTPSRGGSSTWCFLSVVRSEGPFGFLKLQNRLNVAMSRQQRLLTVVGDSRHFDTAAAAARGPGAARVPAAVPGRGSDALMVAKVLDFTRREQTADAVGQPRELVVRCDGFRVTLPTSGAGGTLENPFERVVLRLLDLRRYDAAGAGRRDLSPRRSGPVHPAPPRGQGVHRRPPRSARCAAVRRSAALTADRGSRGHLQYLSGLPGADQRHVAADAGVDQRPSCP